MTRLWTTTDVARLGAIAYPGSKRMMPFYLLTRAAGRDSGSAASPRLLWLIVVAKIACLSRLLNVNVVR